jgi:hypothetical protein
MNGTSGYKMISASISESPVSRFVDKLWIRQAQSSRKGFKRPRN